MFLTDLGLPIPLTPYSAVVLGLSLLVVLELVLLLRRRLRRRRLEMKSVNDRSADGADAGRGPQCRRSWSAGRAASSTGE